jgi:hypothetical protein
MKTTILEESPLRVHMELNGRMATHFSHTKIQYPFSPLCAWSR